VLSADGSRVATISTNTVRVWDAMTGMLSGRLLEHDKPVESVAFNSDATRIVTASGNVARVWDTSQGTAIGDPMTHDHRVLAASFSPDGSRVVTVSGSGPGTEKQGRTIGIAQVWDWTKGVPVGKPLKQKHPIRSAVLSPKGTLVLITSGNHALMWNPVEAVPIGKPMQHAGAEQWVTSAAFSPDGVRVVTSSTDNTARLWDVETGAPIGMPMRHDGEVNSASFSADGGRILTASADKTARVWDARTGVRIGQPLGHADAVKSAVFSSDGAHIVTASGNTARVWIAPPVALSIVATACKMLGDQGVSNVAARYGIEIKDPICAEDAPASNTEH
jgi:WD40 repeat protein